MVMEEHTDTKKYVNKQFRVRSYSVKLSDVIAVPRKETSEMSHNNYNDYSDTITPSLVPLSIQILIIQTPALIPMMIGLCHVPPMMSRKL